MTAKRPYDHGQNPRTNPVSAGWRLFIAIPLPETVIDHIHQIVAELSSTNLPVRWIDPGSSHLTLHFLGDTSPERAELLRMTLSSFTPQVSQFRLLTGQIGVFPNDRRPRVIWLGLRGQTDRLTSLHGETGDLLNRLGFQTEDRALNAHITLGRARDNPPREFSQLLRAASSTKSLADLTRDRVALQVDQVRLYRSFLERTGARHEIVAKVALKSR